MNRRTTAAAVLAAALALTACTGAPEPGDVAARTHGCTGGCAPELGPPQTTYCPPMSGACNGLPIAPERVSGALFAGVRVHATGTVTH